MHIKRKKSNGLCCANNNSIMSSVFITFSLLLMINPFKDLEITSFDRQLGSGLLANIDVTKRISNMIKYNFILVPVLFLIIFIITNSIFNHINRKYENEMYDECIKFINLTSIIGMIPLVFAYINIFSGNRSLAIGVIIPLIIIMACICFLIMNILNLKFEFRCFKWGLFASIPLTYLIGVLYQNVRGDISLIKILILYIIITTIVIAFYRLINKFIDFNRISKVYIVVMVAPIISVIANEICNILTQYSIIINSKVKITLVIYISMIILAILLYFLMKHNKDGNFKFENFYYPIIIIGFSLILTQLPYQIIANTELFEQANHGIAINEFLKNWSIPIVENFDAHMLQNQIGSIIFGLLNGDSLGAVFIGYSLNPLIILTYYFMFKKFFNRDCALLLTLLFPIEAEKTFFVFPLAPFVILVFLYAYKNKNYKGYIAFWSSIAISALYRLDMGFAIAMAAIITWIIMFILDKNKVSIKKLTLACILVVSICLIVYIAACFATGINPIDRIFEVLRIISSNINWGYDKIGSENEISFVLNYFIVPISVVFIIGMLILKKYQQKISDNNFITTLILGFIFIFNYSRGIVRHSLYEGTNAFVLSTYVLFIGFAIALIKNKNKELMFVVASISAFIITCMSMNNNNIVVKPLVVSSLEKYINFEDYRTIYKENEKRVIISDEMKSIYEPLKEVLDSVLKEDESYIDFTNQTLLYALVDRKNPVYINQSPGLLSGESLQQTFIKECEENIDDLPFVLMPLEKGVLAQELDGILNSYRYYLVTEYIGSNYEPLFKNEDFAIWVKKDRKDEMYSKVLNYIDSNKKYSSKIQFIDYNYLDLRYHTHQLLNIPYIWAEYDEKTVAEKENQLEINNSNLDENIYEFNNIDKSEGNYLKINVTSSEERVLTIKFGKMNNDVFETLNEFTISIKPYENQDYLIRISGDFMWYSNEINAIRVEDPKDSIIINDISILKGDVLKD